MYNSDEEPKFNIYARCNCPFIKRDEHYLEEEREPFVYCDYVRNFSNDHETVFLCRTFNGANYDLIEELINSLIKGTFNECMFVYLNYASDLKILFPNWWRKIIINSFDKLIFDKLEPVLNNMFSEYEHIWEPDLILLKAMKE